MLIWFLVINFAISWHKCLFRQSLHSTIVVCHFSHVVGSAIFEVGETSCVQSLVIVHVKFAWGVVQTHHCLTAELIYGWAWKDWIQKPWNVVYGNRSNFFLFNGWRGQQVCHQQLKKKKSIKKHICITTESLDHQAALLSCAKCVAFVELIIAAQSGQNITDKGNLCRVAPEEGKLWMYQMFQEHFEVEEWVAIWIVFSHP